MFQREAASTFIVNKDGTYNGTSWLLVNRSACEEDMVLTCLVEHDRESPVVKSHTLVVVVHYKDQDINTMVRPLLSCFCVCRFYLFFFKI